jgi:uncharacterized protein with von Willebrand factor type A (vWA) domain
MPSSKSLAELGDFLAALRVNGVPVGPEEIDRLRRLFALAPNLERQGLQSLLRALLVKTPEHRQTFEALFADWCPERNADWQEDVGYAPEPTTHPRAGTASGACPTDNRRHYHSTAASGSAVCMEPSRRRGAVGIVAVGLLATACGRHAAPRACRGSRQTSSGNVFSLS